MELDLALIAAAANVSREGNLNILGAYNALQVPRETPTPLTLPPLAFVLRFIAHPDDIGSHKVGLRLRNEDGELLWSSPDVEFEARPSPIPGIPMLCQIIAGAMGIQVPGVGSYEFEVALDGAPAKGRGTATAHGPELHILAVDAGSP